MNNPNKAKAMQQIIRKEKFQVMGIMETRIKQYNTKKLLANRKKIAPNWCWVDNYSYAPNGKMWVCWDPNYVKGDVVHTSAQSITMRVKDMDGKHSFLISYIYGLHTVEDRRSLWEELGSLGR